MIRNIMNQSIIIIRIAHGLKGKYPRYINLWSFPKISKYLLSHNVPVEKIETLLDIYKTLRFG